MPSLLQPSVDYTDKDFPALRLRLQGLARSVFPKWTEYNTPSFGNLLLEFMAFTGDNTTFYQDGQGRELFWPTVSQRENAIRLGRLINYNLPSAQPSTVTCRFTTPSLLAIEAPIPEGQRIRTVDATGVPFRTKVGGSILVGQDTVDIEC